MRWWCTCIVTVCVEVELVSLGIFRADLHIHTVLSPCTEVAEMTPRAIVERAVEQGLSLIAICDHNSSRNVGATIRAASGKPLTVIPGIEITSAEEVHVLGLFATAEVAETAQDEVYARLIGQNDEDTFGVQAVVNENDEVEDLDDRLLIGATTLRTERVVEIIHRCGGLAVASHVDRQGFGIFAQLGFIPETMALDALEISRHVTYENARKKFPQTRKFTLVQSSDAHYLSDVGIVSTTLRLRDPSYEELALALRGIAGREVVEAD